MTGADFAHGQAQLRAMLSDRPALGEILVDDDPLRTWTAARFAGAASGFRITWDGICPPAGVEAQSRFDPRPAIRVHPLHQHGRLAGTRKSPGDLWADLVFELHNIAQAPKFRAAWRRVLAGELSEAGWIEAVTRAEHRALLDSRAFYRTRWRPWMRRREVAPLTHRWRQVLAVPTQYEAWIARYRDERFYPYHDYGGSYRRALKSLQAAGRDWSINPFALHDIPPLSRD